MGNSFDPAMSMPRSGGSGWRSCLIGCSIVFVLLIIVGGVGVFLFFRWASGRMSHDRQVVAKWVSETIQAEPPPGYAGLGGVNFTVGGFGMKMLLIGPQDVQDPQGPMEGRTLFFVFSMPGLPPDQLQMQFEAQRNQPQFMGPRPQAAQNVKVESKKVEVEAANGVAEGTLTTRTTDGKGQIEYMIAVKPDTMLVAFGPADTFDQKAFDAFMKKINVTGARAKGAQPADAKAAPPIDAKAAAPAEEKGAAPKDAPKNDEPKEGAEATKKTA